jgi:hypothetical protein
MKPPIETRLLSWASRHTYRGVLFNAGFSVYVALSVLILAGLFLARITGTLEESRDVIMPAAYLAAFIFVSLFILPVYVAIFIGPYFATFAALSRKGFGIGHSRLISLFTQLGYLAVVAAAISIAALLK